MLLACCSQPRDRTATVTGQTVYGEMGVEGVRVQAVTLPPDTGGIVAETRSSYHGAFRLRLPPGRYRLEARGRLPAAAGDTTSLAGRRDLDVPPGTARLDRVRVRLRERLP